MKIRLIIILGALLTFVASCSDFLEKPIKGFQTLDSFYSTEEECEYAIIGAYQSLSPEDWWEMDFFWLVGDVCSDDAFKGNSIEGDQQEFGNLARWIIDSENEWLDIKWRYSYITISRANLIIEYVPQASISQDIKDMIVGEAKFLKALAYFEIVKNFGGAILLDGQPTANDVYARSTEDKSWAFIEQNLIDAAAALPLLSEMPADKLGRATKGAAMAYLAKAFLYQKKYTEAKDMAQQVIDLNEYMLEPSFGNIWSVSNPNGVESIFEIQHNYDPTQWTGNALPVLTRSRADGGWGFGTPSSHLENFMQGDPRLAFTIIKHGDNVDADHASYDASLSENESGRINRKFYLGFADRVPDAEHVKAPLNYIMLRYADVLLMHAEASYHSGDEAAARTSLNAVRTRAGIATVNDAGGALLQTIYDERRMELALEGHRYYDLKRTDRLAPAMADFVDYNMNRSSDSYDAGNAQGELFDPIKHYIFPIPQSEIDLSNGAIEQNANY